eukprot:jgi/Bigna1/91166/estExt_fgenesh1_pg.C_910025
MKKRRGGSRQFGASKESLPIQKCQREIVRTIREFPVVVIAGATGSGKSTQVPQFILQSEEDAKIVVTQPRRISVLSLAHRVASERGERVGENAIGYQIRLERRISPRTRLSYVTTGVLLRQLMGTVRGASQHLFCTYSHIIVDEVHERDSSIDILLIVVKRLLKVNRHLRVILMSATLDASLFSKYFEDAPVLRVPQRAYRVTVFYYNKGNGSRNMFERSTACNDEEDKKEDAAIIATDNLDYRCKMESQESMNKTGEDDDDRWGGCWGEEIINHNISRDADGAENDNAISGWWGKHDEGEASEVKRKKRETKKKEEDEEEEDPWSIFGSSCFEWGGQDRSNEEHCSKNQSMNKLEVGDSSEFISPAVDPDLVAQTIWHIHSTTRSDDGGGGAILVFVGGWNDIVAVKAKLRYDYMLSSSSSSTSNLWRNNRCTTTTTTSFDIDRKMSIKNKQKGEQNRDSIWGMVTRGRYSQAKAILSCKWWTLLLKFRPWLTTTTTTPPLQILEITLLSHMWISRAGAEQRKGRAGRVGPGYCYRLYSKKFFEEQMQMFCKPEILRTPLAEVGLQIKALFPHDRIEDILSQLLQPPPAAEIKAAISFLRSSKIIDVEENLTVLGSSLAQLPVSIRAGQLLLYGAAFQCLSPMLTLAASTCTRDVWTMLSDKEEKRKVSYLK